MALVPTQELRELNTLQISPVTPYIFSIVQCSGLFSPKKMENLITSTLLDRASNLLKITAEPELVIPIPFGTKQP